MALSPGTRLGPYEILGRIGAGGMGEVYRASDTRLRRDVAIKVSAERFSDRFEREARAVAALNHPSICTLHDVGPNYLVMELVEGETLANRIKQGAIPLEEALTIARQIADALEAAHEKGIVHRDLKPGNIMIKPDGMVKVLDFGLAKVDQQNPRHGEDASTLTATEAGLILGTPSYMAPEQAQGKPVDKRADIWAFGVIVHEMLTGRRLFAGATMSEILAKVLTREPEWDRISARGLPLLRRCLEKDPKRRLRDIGEARFLLEAQPATNPAGARRLPWIVAGTLAAALAGALWSAKPSASPDRPLMRLKVDLGPEAIHGAILEPAISPDGARLVFLARSPEGQARLAVRSLEGSQIALLAGTENAVSPFFFRDGEWIGFQVGGKFKKVPVQGGAVVALTDAPPGPLGVSWDDHQNVVFAPSMVSSLIRVPADGRRTPLTNAGERGDGTHRWPQVLPSGGAVLFTSHKIITGFDDATIEAVAIPSGERKTLVRGGYFGRYVETGSGGYLLYVREGALFAVRFDPRSLTVQGTPVPMLDDIAGDPDIGAGQFDIANNGTLIYRSGKGPARKWPILWMDSSGKTEPLLAEPDAYYTIRLSPSGKRLAMTVDHGDKGREIEVYDLQRGSLTRLTFTGEVNLFPVWSPDGKYILFESSSPRGYGLGLVRSDGSGTLQRLAENSNLMIPQSFSPDGRQLVYTAAPGGAWVALFDTTDPDRPKLGKPELLLRGAGSPTISPDGHWFAYASAESGRNEVYVQPFPGPGPKLQISTSGYGYGGLAWAPSGHDLFFMSLDNRLMATSYAMKDNMFTADKPRVWSNTAIGVASTFPRQFSVSPDGKRFAVFPLRDAPATGSVHVTFALNFADELRRRVK